MSFDKKNLSITTKQEIRVWSEFPGTCAQGCRFLAWDNNQCKLFNVMLDAAKHDDLECLRCDECLRAEKEGGEKDD